MQWKILYAKHIQHNEWDTETVEKNTVRGMQHKLAPTDTGTYRPAETHTNKKQRAKSTADKPSPAGMGLSNLSVPWL